MNYIRTGWIVAIPKGAPANRNRRKVIAVMSWDRTAAIAEARWLGELADALRDAERLTTSLARWRSGSAEAVALRTRIKAARSEVHALQHRLFAAGRPTEPDPLWTVAGDYGPRPDQTP